MKSFIKEKWKYLFGAFLLAMGLLVGCAEEAVQPPQATETEESQKLERQDAEKQETEKQSEENPESERNEAQEQATREPESEFLQGAEQEAEETPSEVGIAEDGTYTSKEEVAEYIVLYGHLPDNFITKKEAKALGWVSSEGNLGEVAPGKSIGGDYFGNFEGSLPEKEGRDYHECDIDSDGGYRGAKRIVYSNDGLIYYTENHYETFELLYGEE